MKSESGKDLGQEDFVMESDFESILNLVGGFGKFQKKLLILILIPVSFFIAVTVNLVYFQLIVPDYWCHVPANGHSELTQHEWKNLTIPKKEDGSYDKCLHYKTTFVDDKNISVVTNETQECDYGWDHDISIFWETVATEEDWLCEKEIYSTHILAFNMAGNTIGVIILPILADRITGRKFIFFVTLAINLIFNIAILFVRQFYLSAIFRFFAGLGFPTNFQMAYVVTLEFLSPEHRSMAAFISFVAWTFGMCFSAILAYLLPHWWYLVIVSAVPTVAFFGLWRFFPESPRWMLSKGKLDECSQTLLQVAKTNGISDVTEDILKEKLKIQWKIINSTKIRFKEILKFVRFCKNALVISILAMLTWTVYGCVLLNMSILPDHYFLNFFILSLIELPSDIIGLLSVDYLGRRMSSLLTFSLAAAFSLLSLLTLDNRVILLCMVSMVKIFSTIAQYVVYVIAGEIFPTPIRSIGLGITGVAATLGMLLSPYMIEAGETFEYAAMIAISFVCLLLGLLLPETIGLPLPQTLQDAEILGQERTFFRWIHHWNVEKWAPCDPDETKEND